MLKSCVIWRWHAWNRTKTNLHVRQQVSVICYKRNYKLYLVIFARLMSPIRRFQKKIDTFTIPGEIYLLQDTQTKQRRLKLEAIWLDSKKKH